MPEGFLSFMFGYRFCELLKVFWGLVSLVLMADALICVGRVSFSFSECGLAGLPC